MELYEVCDSIQADKQVFESLQRLYDGYTKRCNELRELEGNADGVGDEWTDKAVDIIIDFCLANDIEDVDYSQVDVVLCDEYLS